MIEKLQINPTYSNNYKIIIDSSLDFSYISDYVDNKQVFILTNTTIRDIYLKNISDYISKRTFVQTFILEDGEEYKSQQSLDNILKCLLDNKFTRFSTVLIALGGGVIGDIAGFAAAIYQRGVDFIQIPTTLLSQVDSSIGGKTAINHPLGKNMIGAFYQPKIVYTSIEFYKTLPEKEFVAGMAEVVKYAFISSEFYDWLRCNRLKILDKDQKTLIYMIKKSCQIKAKLVREDEKELTGVRSILNFGHTFGHAIEKCQKYLGLKHGEAIGIGMGQAIDFSYFLGMLNLQQTNKFKDFITDFNISIKFPKDINRNEYLESILLDKKNSNKMIRVILINNIGNLQLLSQSHETIKRFLDI